MNLIFDLDGTLIDSRMRLYCLFQKLVPQCNLSFDQYWNFKRNKISNATILSEHFGFDTVHINEFHSEWMGKIEAAEFLALDQNFPAIFETLDRLKLQAKLYVCTARQSKKPAVDQLDRLGLLPYFEDIMVTEQRLSKAELISRILDLGSEDWIIGDTGLDIQVGQSMGIRTCAVLTGFLSEVSLRAYMPDLIINSAADFSMPAH